MLNFFKKNKALKQKAQEEYEERERYYRQMEDEYGERIKKTYKDCSPRKGFRRVSYYVGDGSIYVALHVIEQGTFEVGYFHKWVKKSYIHSSDKEMDIHGYQNIWALIEDLEGKTLLAHQLCVKFLD